jgi:hypothetical protein
MRESLSFMHDYAVCSCAFSSLHPVTEVHSTAITSDGACGVLTVTGSEIEVLRRLGSFCTQFT